MVEAEQYGYTIQQFTGHGIMYKDKNGTAFESKQDLIVVVMHINMLLNSEQKLLN